MSGKKAAITLIGVVLLVSLLIALAIKIFFATYEPKPVEESVTFKTTSEQILIE